MLLFRKEDIDKIMIDDSVETIEWKWVKLGKWTIDGINTHGLFDALGKNYNTLFVSNDISFLTDEFKEFFKVYVCDNLNIKGVVVAANVDYIDENKPIKLLRRVECDMENYWNV